MKCDACLHHHKDAVCSICGCQTSSYATDGNVTDDSKEREAIFARECARAEAAVAASPGVAMRAEIGDMASALRIVVRCQTRDTWGDDSTTYVCAEFTAEELEEMLFSLTRASSKLMCLPGGKEATERAYARAKAEQQRRSNEP